VSDIARRYGSQACVLAIDARAKGDGGWQVVIDGGRVPTGKDAVAWAREGVERGAGEILLTSMDRDGTKEGFDLPLVAAVARAVATGTVLMLAWMDREAIEATERTGEVHFHSRSRGALWRKGETSGNTLHAVEVLPDCDRDTLLVRAHPMGPVCHTGSATC